MELVPIECQKVDFSINKYTPFGWGRGSAHIVLKDTERFVKCECATPHWKPSFAGAPGGLCGGGGHFLTKTQSYAININFQSSVLLVADSVFSSLVAFIGTHDRHLRWPARTHTLVNQSTLAQVSVHLRTSLIFYDGPSWHLDCDQDNLLASHPTKKFTGCDGDGLGIGWGVWLGFWEVDLPPPHSQSGIHIFGQ